MKYLIIEDEELAADRLRVLVQKQRPDWELLQVIPTVRQAVKSLSGLKPDLIFLDIHLSDGNSFSIFDQIIIDIPIIFTTAYDSYALKAFELNSIDYLLKPVNEADLKRGIEKFENRSGHSAEPDWKKILSDLKPSYKDRFMVSTGSRIKSLPVDEISFFFAQGKHTFIIDQSLTQLNDLLNPKKFFQINRQYIVCFDCIEEMIPYSKSRLKIITKVDTPTEAIVSVDRAPKFKKWLEGE